MSNNPSNQRAEQKTERSGNENTKKRPLAAVRCENNGADESGEEANGSQDQGAEKDNSDSDARRGAIAAQSEPPANKRSRASAQSHAR